MNKISDRDRNISSEYISLVLQIGSELENLLFKLFTNVYLPVLMNMFNTLLYALSIIISTQTFTDEMVLLGDLHVDGLVDGVNITHLADNAMRTEDETKTEQRVTVEAYMENLHVYEVSSGCILFRGPFVPPSKCKHLKEYYVIFFIFTRTDYCLKYILYI